MASFFRRKAQQVSKKPQKSQLSLQALEDRAVPAAFVVNNSGDNIDPSPTVTTLREALTTAATNGEDDTITFDAGITNITYNNATPQVQITEGKSLTITGNGADKLTINAGAADTGFTVTAGAAGSVTSISGLTITHGGTNAVLIQAANAPTVTLDKLEIIGTGIGVNVLGGSTKMTNSTITGEAIGFIAQGAGTVATIQNSTIAFNPGIGVEVLGGTATIQNSTIANNGGLGIAGLANTITISSVIVARNNTAATDDVTVNTFTGNCNNNIIGKAPAGGAGGGVANGSNGNQVGTQATPFDPGLAAFLSNNGGTTRTITLTASSQALDKGVQNGLTTDQRGVARPATGADVGAVEAGTAAATGTGTGTSTSTATATATATGTATGTGTSTSGSSQNAIINQLVIANLQKVFAQPLPPAIALALIVGLQDVNGDGFNDVIALVGLNVKQNGKNRVMLFRLVFDGLSPSSALIGSPQVLGTF